MDTLKEFEDTLRSFSNEQTKKTYIKHGAKESLVLGVKIGDIAKVVKQYKKNHELGVALSQTDYEEQIYASASLIDPKRVSRDFIVNLSKRTYWYMNSEYTISKIASNHEDGFIIAKEFITSDIDHIKASGYAILGGLIAKGLLTDEEFISERLNYIKENIHTESNRTKYTMNGFVLSLGVYNEDYFNDCYFIGEHMGKVKVDMGKTACKVPYIPDYLSKVQERKNKINK